MDVNNEKTLRDAKDLLNMLEHLFDKFANGNNRASNSNVPWAGIVLTVTQCRELLESVELANNPNQYDTDRANVEQEPVLQNNLSQNNSSDRALPLSQRIQKIPGANSRVRELVGNSN